MTEIVTFPTQPVYLRALFAKDRSPTWMAQAECRSAELPDTIAGTPRAFWMYHKAGTHSEQHFADDLGKIEEIESYRWPASVRTAMRVCDSCPVRRECLAYAYEIEVTWPDFAASWASTFRPREMRIRFGVWGGIPAPVRSRFAPFAERLELAEAWFQRTMGGAPLEEEETA